MHVHAINKQAYEFTCTSESVAKKVQREIEDHTALQINNIISSVLSEHFKTGHHLKIDKIEIDLGDILLSDFGDTGMLDTFKKIFDEEISVADNAIRMNHYKIVGDDTAVPERFKKITDGKIPVAGNGNRTNHYKSAGPDTALPDGFKKPIDRKTPVAGKGSNRMDHYKDVGVDTDVPDQFKNYDDTIPAEGNGNRADNDTVEDDTGSPDNLENELAIIRLFLMQGDVPWWADKKNDIDFDNTLQKLIHIYPDSLTSFLEEHKEQWQVLWRLTKQYKRATRVILDALAPGILPASISRKIFKDDDALSGGYALPHIIWVKLNSILNKRKPGSVDQLRHTLFRKMIKVANLLQKNTGIGRNLPGVSILAGSSPGIHQHQPQKNTEERLKSLVSNLSVFQIEFLLFQLTLLPDFSTDAYRTPEVTDGTDNPDLPVHEAGNQEKNNTRGKKTGVAETTQAHAASSSGKKPVMPEGPGFQQHDKSPEAFYGAETGKAVVDNETAEKITANDNPFSGGDKNPALLNPNNNDNFLKIAEELARLQHQAFKETRKHLLFSQDEKDKASAGKPETSGAKPGNQLHGDHVGKRALSDLHLKHDTAGKDQATAVTARGWDTPVAAKSDDKPQNDEQQLHPFLLRGANAIQNIIPPNAPGNGDNKTNLPSFTPPDEDPPATGQIKPIKKQSGHSDLPDVFDLAQKDKSWSTQTPGSSSNPVNRKIAFIMKRLNTTKPVFFEYLNNLQESELNRLEETLKKHIRQKLQRRNKIKAILEHPHFLKFSILQIFTNLYVDQEKEKAWSVDREKIAANRKTRVTAVVEKIQWSQSAFLFFTDKLSVRQVMILQDIFEKQQFDSGDEKKVMKKILGKISEEGLLLIEFLTELPEVEIRELLQNSKKPPADITPGNQAPFFYERNEPFKIYVENAGLCLIANYLRGLFKRLDYLENGSFKTKAIAARAIFLIQYMVTGKKKSPEHILQLNKILCGFKTDDCIIPNIRLTKKEVEEADNLLQSVIENWKVLKNTSLNGFRESFLQRKGILLENELYWTLQVERKGYDLLLDTIPWGFRMIKMPWVKKYMQIEW